jgi:hypothetical protein
MHTTALTDTSQNPSYGASTAENRGLVSCITPAGQFFMYCKGRIITGPEKWALNGLLANDGQLKLGCLTEVNMGDMAGNAMSLTVINAAMMSALCIKQLDRFRKKNKKYKLGSGVQSAANVLSNVVPMTLFGKSSSRSSSSSSNGSSNGSSGSGSGNDETLKTMCHNLIQNNLPVRAESLSVCCPCETSGTVSPHDIYRCRDCGLCVCGDTVPRKDACTHNLAVASHDLAGSGNVVCIVDG